jgi:enediyne biosynthesis protein E4
MSCLIWPLVCAMLSEQLLAQEQTAIRLTDVSSQSGIQFVHCDGGSGRRYVVESVVGGLATFDYDGDGYIDIYFANGAELDTEQGSRRLRPALYRNKGDMTFTDVTRQAGLDQAAYGMGAVCADYDQDGDIDLYLSNFGQNVFFENNGDGTFSNVTKQSRLELPDRVGAGCSFLDSDNDGDLDLYVGNYILFSTDQHVDHFMGKYQFHPGPKEYSPSTDNLFRNNGDGTFTDISQIAGISSHASYSMGVVAFDIDEDADIDILVVNDQQANLSWLNDGQGNFEDGGLVSGLALDRLGAANGNMGVDIGDVNGDGMLDIFTTTYQNEMPVMYVNVGDGLFLDQTNLMKITHRLHPHVSWGCGLVDLDNDGDLDLYVACGHFIDNIRYLDDRTDYKVRDFVLENRNAKFVDVSDSVGSGLKIVESSRGAAFEDLDNDGDIDVIVLNANARPSILRNDSPPQSHALVQLVGKTSNRCSVGAKVVVKYPAPLDKRSSATQAQPPQSIQQVKQVVAGRGFQSSYSDRLHFGLSTAVDATIEVTWPSGKKYSGKLSPAMLIVEP